MKFKYPVSDLDKYIKLEQEGASLSISDEIRLEMEIRKKILLAQANGIDEEDDDEYLELIEKHEETVVDRHIPVKREDMPFRELPADIQRQIEEDMKVSYVRNDPASSYNKSDDELYEDEELRVIHEKLSRIRNIYFDAISFRAAILVIKEAIEYSLNHDYPWRPHDEVIADWNSGKIKYHGNIPKLYLDYGTRQITDPEILKGIVEGTVTVIDKDDHEAELKKRKKEKKKEEWHPVRVDYNVCDGPEYEYYARYHNLGYDTPISVTFRTKSTLFDRLSLPFTFGGQQQVKKDTIGDFDWAQENAGEEYYRLVNGIPRTSINQFVTMLNKTNNGELAPVVSTGITNFISSYDRWRNGTSHTVPVTGIQPMSDRAKEMEAHILNAMRTLNPNL